MILLNDQPLAQYTTLGVGGKSRFYAEVQTVSELKQILEDAKVQDLPVFVLGAGSNTLIDDGVFLGYVIHPAMQDSEWMAQDNGQMLVRVGAGASFDKIIEESCRRNLGGIEALSGIPGSAGGSLVQNIGAYGQEISEVFESAEAVHKDSLQTVILDRAAMKFGYRHSALKTRENPYIITSLTLRLSPFDASAASQRCQERGFKALGDTQPKTASELRDQILATRKSKSMCYDKGDINSHSVGSFFVNPVVSRELAKTLADIYNPGLPKPMPQFEAEGGIKLSAAWLIEHAGFYKGFQHKGAALSEKHCLAIINREQATCRDIVELANLIVDSVYNQFKVRLDPEVIYLSPSGPACLKD